MRITILTLLAAIGVCSLGAVAADEPKPKAVGKQDVANAEPAKMLVKFNVTSYGYMPVKGNDIDQLSPSTNFEMTLERNDLRFGFGDTIPGWSGTKEVVLKDGYRLRVKARFLKGQPHGDFQNDKHGLSLDISYLYDKNLIGFQTVTSWASPGAALKATADLKDNAYFALLHSNDFELPSVTDGYMEGFRAWVAVRDGLQKRDKQEANYKSLTEFLKPLSRKDNLMIPTVTVTAKVK